MHDLYDDFAKVYDECGVDDYSLSFGKGMLKYLDLIHPDEKFGYLLWNRNIMRIF